MRVVQARVDASVSGAAVRPRVPQQHRAAMCSAAQTDLGVASPSSDEASGCPVSAVKRLVLNSKSKPLSPERQDEHDRAPQAPGPPALSLESALDVSQILRFGIQEAMLRFNNKYGDVCRFANPARCVLRGPACALVVLGGFESVDAADIYSDRSEANRVQSQRQERLDLRE